MLTKNEVISKTTIIYNISDCILLMNVLLCRLVKQYKATLRNLVLVLLAVSDGPRFLPGVAYTHHASTVRFPLWHIIF